MIRGCFIRFIYLFRFSETNSFFKQVDALVKNVMFVAYLF